MFAPAYDSSAGSTSEELEDPLLALHGADWGTEPAVDAAIVDALALGFGQPLHQQAHSRRHAGGGAAPAGLEPHPEPQQYDAYSYGKDPMEEEEEIVIPGAANMTPSQLKRARRSAIEKKSRQRRQVRGFRCCVCLTTPRGLTCSFSIARASSRTCGTTSSSWSGSIGCC